MVIVWSGNICWILDKYSLSLFMIGAGVRVSIEMEFKEVEEERASKQSTIHPCKFSKNLPVLDELRGRKIKSFPSFVSILKFWKESPTIINFKEDKLDVKAQINPLSFSGAFLDLYRIVTL